MPRKRRPDNATKMGNDNSMRIGVEAEAQACVSLDHYQEEPARHPRKGIITKLEEEVGKRLLPWALSAFKIGSIHVIDSNGQEYTNTRSSEPCIAVQLHDPALPLKLVANPWLNIGEGYVDGTLTIQQGTLGGMLELCLKNAALLKEADNPLFSLITNISMLRTRIKTLLQRNGIVHARQNVAHHYDLSDELYDSFLDNDRQTPLRIFRVRLTLWRRHRKTKSGTSPQSCCSSRDRKYLILEAAGAVSRDTLPENAMSMSRD
jgi:hypothetical protein